MALSVSARRGNPHVGSVLLGFLLLGIIAVAIYFFVKTVDSKIALSVIGLAGAIVTAAVQYRLAKNRESEARLFTEKQGVYTELIELVMSIFLGVKAEKPLDNDHLVKRLQEIKSKLFVWGSYDTIHSLDQMADLDQLDDAQATAAQGIRWIGELLSHIRKDLGHRDPPGSGLEMALGMLVAADRPGVRSRL